MASREAKQIQRSSYTCLNDDMAIDSVGAKGYPSRVPIATATLFDILDIYGTNLTLPAAASYHV